MWPRTRRGPRQRLFAVGRIESPVGAAEKGRPFLLSTESFQAEYVSSTPTSPDVEAFDVSSLRFGTFPTLVAGGLPRSWLGQRTRMAWSFLT
ncbi:MAG: hypothetical protein LJF30_01850 [Acidobacteria bacterium]|nr:hypothetical protein [Acidobacteriota bacterium]